MNPEVQKLLIDANHVPVLDDSTPQSEILAVALAFQISSAIEECAFLENSAGVTDRIMKADPAREE